MLQLARETFHAFRHRLRCRALRLVFLALQDVLRDLT